MDALLTSDNLIALVTLTALEVVLGVDNVIFISILAGKLPTNQQGKARRTGLLAAMGMRILLLLSITWIMRLTHPLFSALGRDISGRDLILICGGLFLLYSSTKEIHAKLEGDHNYVGVEVQGATKSIPMTAGKAIAQIALINVVFSLDSIFTAVGMVKNIWIMVFAVLASTVVMIAASGAIGGFIDRHPTVKMLALSFLLLIGIMLVGEAFGQHIPKGYIYFGMGFSLLVEMLNLKARTKAAKLRTTTG